MTTIRRYILMTLWMIFIWGSGWVIADDTHEEKLILDKNGIKVYSYNHDNSEYATFKAKTFIDASLDSVLAVMFDHRSCQDWVYSCLHSHLIKDVSFNERYHYQVLDVPFPFHDRAFVLHSILKHDPVTQTITIRTTTSINKCHDDNDYLYNQPVEKGHVKVNASIGLFKLESIDGGVNFTWIQHTDPGGHLPKWLVNQFIAQIPYHTFKGLAHKVKEPSYQNSKLIYNKNGVATALEMNSSFTKIAQSTRF